MDGRGGGGWRLARASALAAAALSLSCAAHLLGGGQAPAAPVVGALAVPTLGAAFLLVGRRRGPVVVAAALAAGQVLVHETLMRVGMQVDPGAVPGGGVMAHQVPAVPTLAMVAWHALATVAVAAGLAFGERAVERLVRWALALLPPVLRLVWLRVLLPVQAVDRPPARPHPGMCSASLRGPPTSLAATIS